MKRITQTIVADPARPDVQGNCLQAALASILDLPLAEVPHFVQDDHDHPDDPEWNWFTRMLAWLDARGLNLRDGSNAPPGALVLALGTSPRGLGHIVIQRDGETARWCTTRTRTGLGSWTCRPPGDSWTRCAMCDATLADAGRIPCQRTDPHEPHRGCLYTLTDQADAVHHDHQLEDQ